MEGASYSRKLLLPEDIITRINNAVSSMPAFSDAPAQPENTSLSSGWDPERQVRDLCIEGISAKYILDDGCGQGGLVGYLNSLGNTVEGIDAQNAGQNPDIKRAMAHDLPFSDNFFDLVINHFGGLTYPAFMKTSPEDTEEVKKDRVITFLVSLAEAIRVSHDEVRIYPWSAKPFGERFGIPSLAVKGRVSTILAINFHKVFEEMGLEVEYQYGEDGALDSPQIPLATLVIRGCGNASLEALRNLIDQVIGTDESTILGESDISRFKNIKAIASGQSALSQLERLANGINGLLAMNGDEYNSRSSALVGILEGYDFFTNKKISEGKDEKNEMLNKSVSIIQEKIDSLQNSLEDLQVKVQEGGLGFDLIND